MNKTITKALLSAAVLTSGIVGAGSVIAQASDDSAITTAVVATSEASDAGAPAGFQTTEVVDDGDGRGCGTNEAVAETLGLTSDELHAARESGSTIGEIATSQGVDVDDVVQAIVDGKAERLDEKVAAGDLTSDEAAERLAGAEERAVDKVNGES